MSDPKYNKYAGTVRFDDDNIVDIELQPDTENIRVLLNGGEVTGDLPVVTSADNGDVLTVVEGEWTNAAPASQLPAVSGSDNGNVLTVVEGAWAKAAPAAGGGDFYVDFSVDPQDPSVTVANKTIAQIAEAVTGGLRVIGRYQVFIDNVLDTVNYMPLASIFLTEGDEYAIFEGLGPVFENQMPVWVYAVGTDGVIYSERLIDLATPVG